MSTSLSRHAAPPAPEPRAKHQPPPVPPPPGPDEGGSWLGWYEPVKTAVDVGLALVLLVVCAPVIALTALAVRLTSSGPAFYSQTRVGKNGKPFRIYKLRTMYHNCELKSGVRWAVPGDSRITPLGRFLRKTHLDELPQLVNVLRLEMSLVGPRPERPEIIPGLEEVLPNYRDRLRVRPGVTGLAQLRLPADVDIPGVRRKLIYDLHYIRAVGPWLDLRLVACTVLKMAGLPLAGVLWLFGIPEVDGRETMGDGAARPGRFRRLARRGLQLAVLVLIILAAHAGWNSYRYGVPFATSVRGSLKEAALTAIRLGVGVYDPYQPRLARTGPDGDLPGGGGYERVEKMFPPGTPVRAGAGMVTALEVSNERIIRSRYPFAYQPYDEPRLHELRRKYRLDEVVAPAKTEFEAMVLLRNWGRSQFRRRDYQPRMENFDALVVLDRNHREHGEQLNLGRHMDPCHFFPMFYCQLAVSLGHTARLLSSNDHGLAEVWSNEYRKWVLMDAEYNHHFEKDGIPLNAAELGDENHAANPSRVRLVPGRQWSGDESTTLGHLGIKELTAADAIPVYRAHLFYFLRNDWMTNHYFPGHPRRSEPTCLGYTHPALAGLWVGYDKRLRPYTGDREDAYWTLNQTEILARSGTDGLLDLGFTTVTPNIESFEVVVDGDRPVRVAGSTFPWRPRAGENRLTVRAVNRFGVRGIDSTVRLVYTPGGR